MKKIMSIEDYHADPSISKSKLDLIEESVFHYLNPVPRESDSFDFGSAVHDCVLLPEVFAKKYIQAPEKHDGRKGDGRRLLEQCKELDQTLLKHDLYNGILSIKERLYKTPLIANMLTNSEKEMSYFSKLRIDGREHNVKCRFDFRLGSDAMDFKTTRSTKDQDLKWAIKRYRYNVQSSFYSDVYKAESGEEIENFIFVFIENKPPFHIVVRLLDRESEDLGRKQYLNNLKELGKYLDDPEKYMEMKVSTIGLPASSFYAEEN